VRSTRLNPSIALVLNDRRQPDSVKGSEGENAPLTCGVSDAARTRDIQDHKPCRDLANGGSVQPYIDGTEKRSPQLLPQEAAQVVHDAIESYYPQYAG
jgi:hypothetical protein